MVSLHEHRDGRKDRKEAPYTRPIQLHTLPELRHRKRLQLTAAERHTQFVLN